MGRSVPAGQAGARALARRGTPTRRLAGTGKPLLASGAELDVWYDGSGRGGNVAQLTKGAQPRYVAGERVAAVRFDGEDDYLHRGVGTRELGNFTLVLAVAPRTNIGGFRALISAAQTGKNDYVTGLNVDFGTVRIRGIRRAQRRGAGVRRDAQPA